MGLGYLVARRGIIGPRESKAIAYVYINVLFPSLIFSRTVLGINSENISALPYLVFGAFFYVILGALFGVAVVKIFNSPKGFRYTLVASMAFTNTGDFPIALGTSLGDRPPFHPGDSAAAVGYVSGYLTVYSVLIFVIGMNLVVRDYELTETMKKLAADEEARRATEIADIVQAVDTEASSGSEASNETELADVDQRTGNGTAMVVPVALPLTRRRSSRAIVPAVSESKDADMGKTMATANTFSSTVPMIDEPVHESQMSAWRRFVLRTRRLYRQIFPPAFPFLNLLACGAGLLAGAVPALKILFINPACGTNPTDCTPLGWFWDILAFVGSASVPISLLNLGAALGTVKIRGGFPFLRGILPTTIAKLVIMPAVAIPIVQALTGPWIPAGNTMLRFILLFDSQLVSPTGEAGAAAALAAVQYLVSAVTMTVCVGVILWLLGKDA
ncbi:auxin efflux carrier [Hyaloraphidium curvatum]|nr:auxin efflux carrier [Hyaloraphidium curvatum]